MGSKINLLGEVFGRLVVISEAENVSNRTHWECKCSCGNTKIVSTHNLRSGVTRSCGCLVKETTTSKNISRAGTETFAFNDLSGVRFGRLVAISRSGHDRERILWECKCDCGNTAFVISGNLMAGVTKSCGCLKKELLAERNKSTSQRSSFKHKTGSKKLFTREQILMKSVLRGMINRCHNKNHPAYKNYGARGITVCDEWKQSFDSFYEDMSDGYTIGLTIDRINNDLGYCKQNCRWATPLEQAHNRRTRK